MDELRELIDSKNEEILKSFQERLKLVLKIFNIKKQKGLPIKDLNRENQILKSVLDKSLKKFKELDYVLFLNILNLSRFMQYEKLNKLKNSSELYPFLDESLYYKNLNVVSFDVEKELFSLEQFKKYNVKSVATLKEAFKLLSNEKADILFYRVKKPNLAEIKLLRRNKTYLNCFIKFNGKTYFIVSKKIYLDSGENFICLCLNVKEENFGLLNILTMLFLNKSEINRMYVNKTDKKNLDIFLKLKVYYKDLNRIKGLIKMLNCEFKLELLCCYKKMEIGF